MRSSTLYLWIVVLLSVALGFLLGSNPVFVNQYSPVPIKGGQRLHQLVRYIDRDYVDKIDTDSLVDLVIEDVIDRLDPHSAFIPEDELRFVNENMQGEFVGIGVSFFMMDDSLKIVRVIENGPSEKVGILAGDRILSANQDTLYGKNLSSGAIVEKLRGKPDTEVTLDLFRPKTNRRFPLKLKRAAVPIVSVYHYAINDDTGYIKINRFAQTTSTEFETALHELKRQGVTQLILDLRDNPGGYMFAAEKIADHFLAAGQSIVKIRSNQGKEEVTLAKEGGSFEDGQVYVLINGQSASASEVLAGALQDNDRAWLLGQRSFGKGLVQQQMPLGSGSAIRLTTARYYTPTGRSIQRPYTKGEGERYYQEAQDRFNSGELADKSKIPLNDSLAFTTPGGRTVYGGGGIVPDIYLENTNTLDDEWNNYILSSNLMNHFVFTVLDKDRTQWEKISREELITQPLPNPSQWMKDLKSYLREQSVPVQVQDTTQIYTVIRAYLGLQLFDEATRFEILHQNDAYVQQALEALKNSPKD